MNGEKAAYGTPIFKDKRERTLDLLIRNLEKDYDAMMVSEIVASLDSFMVNASVMTGTSSILADLAPDFVTQDPEEEGASQSDWVSADRPGVFVCQMIWYDMTWLWQVPFSISD